VTRFSDIFETFSKIVLQGQTAHADTVAGLPLCGLRRTAESVRSTLLETFSAQLPPLTRVTGNDGFHTKSLLTKQIHSFIFV